MIPKNKRHLIVNKEYSRLPYWTDEGFDDVQRQVSQKYVQDNYGKFAESENQLPYMTDADYQGNEYQYQNPEYFDPTDLPDVDFTDTVPKGTCYELWNSLFGNKIGAFIPTESEWNNLAEYAKKCPVIYVPHICCLGMKISGPDTLTPGEEAYYSVSGGDAGCAYDMEASGGEFVGNKYFAPMTPGTYELSVTPWMSDDSGKKCATKSVTVSGGCDGKIGYTTLQMSTGGTQTLTVTGSTGGTYTWATTSGSISPSEGTSVTFTAPATNANCSSNPTITLTCDRSVVDTITIAVNQVTSSYAAYEFNGECEQGCRQVGLMCEYYYQYLKTKYTCNGSIYSGPTVTTIRSGSTGCDDTDYPACANLKAFCDSTSLCIAAGGCCNTYTHGFVDLRTPAQKAAGCCPAGLL